MPGPSSSEASISHFEAASEMMPVSAVVFEILLSLANEPCHGYAIMKRVEERTSGRVLLRPGSLYRAVNRLLNDRVLEETEPRADEESPDERRRYYRLTALGRELVRLEAQRLRELVDHAYAQKILEPGESG